jgi:hypothetical protein
MTLWIVKRNGGVPVFSGFGEVSDLLRQIIAESDEDGAEGLLPEEADEDLQPYLCAVLNGEDEEGN